MNNFYPFAAILGEEKAKKAMMLLCINPRIGSVLLIGKKGCGKTLLLHSVKEWIAPEHSVHVPVHCTTDRLLGGMSFEDAALKGEKKPEKGLLSMANGGYLFLDQMNLLTDRLLGMIFRTQQDRRLSPEGGGIDCEEEVRFSVFAAMNPEDGEVSKSQLDAVGMSVVLGDGDAKKNQGDGVNHRDVPEKVGDRRAFACQSAEMMAQWMEYEDNPSAFCRKYEGLTAELRRRIQRAKAMLPDCRLHSDRLMRIAELVREAGCVGHRGELFLCETAMAIAAFDGRSEVEDSDIAEAAQYVLPHRMRNPNGVSMEKFSSFDASPEPEDGNPKELPAQNANENVSEEDARHPATVDEGGDPDSQREGEQEKAGEADSEGDWVMPLAAESGGTSYEIGTEKGKAVGYGRRRTLRSNLQRGHEIGAIAPKDRVRDLSLMSTLRAALADHTPCTAVAKEGESFHAHLCAESGTESDACGGAWSGGTAGACGKKPLLKIRAAHLREKKREATGGARILFLVDGSASMGAQRRMMLVKRVVLSILEESYVHRDFVGLMVFRGADAKPVLPFTRSTKRAERCMEELRTGGKTPLLLGLEKALRYLRADAIKHKHSRYELILVSDGKNNVLPREASFEEYLTGIRKRLYRSGVSVTVVDTESGFMRFGFAKKLAEILDARYHCVDSFRGLSYLDIF